MQIFIIILKLDILIMVCVTHTYVYPIYMCE